MKTITLTIPDGMRIGEAIWKAIKSNPIRNTGHKGMLENLYSIEDQDLLSLLEKLDERTN